MTRALLATIGALALALLTGCATARVDTAVPYLPDHQPGTVWGELDERPDSRARLATDPHTRGIVALVRVEGHRLVSPSAADLEALEIGTPSSHSHIGYGPPMALSRLAPPPGAPLPKVGVEALRREAAARGAEGLLVARFEGEGARRRLRASLHLVADGAILATYGPGEPSLAMAAHRVIAERPTKVYSHQ